jgi:hypothetical protein
MTKINERATGAEHFSQFFEDKNIIDMLNDDAEGGEEKFFQAIDMGELDEEERQYLLIDKDTGRVYDLRNDTHLNHITSKNTRLTVDTSVNNISSSSHQSQTPLPSSSSAKGGNAWGDWWKQKKRNNQDLLWASENGNLEEVKKLMDPNQLQDLIADVNHRGLDNWTALHFAANEGHFEVVKELLTHTDLEKEPLSSINRTPTHLAAIRGHSNILRALLNSQTKPICDTNIRDFDESTPLHYASEYGHADSIICLIKEAGADPFLKNKFGYTPSDIA